MKVNSLHLLLTYQCNLECEHCFVWGSPWQSGTMSSSDIRLIMDQAEEMGGIDSFYFEGGEPFFYYATLVNAVEMAVNRGFKVGMVSNGYWATSVEDARLWLAPFEGKIQDLSISNDFYHWNERLAQQVQNARVAAEQLGIPVGYITIAQPETAAEEAVGQLPTGESAVMFRGRAAEALAPQATHFPGRQFTHCPYENLRDPGRIHIDPLGFVHMCQGIAIGNLFQQPLVKIVAEYDPDNHPIVGPLLAGGPAGLAEQYKLIPLQKAADACHLCYETRVALRAQFPQELAPDQMYGVV